MKKYLCKKSDVMTLKLVLRSRLKSNSNSVSDFLRLNAVRSLLAKNAYFLI